MVVPVAALVWVRALVTASELLKFKMPEFVIVKLVNGVPPTAAPNVVVAVPDLTVSAWAPLTVLVAAVVIPPPVCAPAFVVSQDTVLASATVPENEMDPFAVVVIEFETLTPPEALF